jgi:hypothetical protein
MLDRCPTLDRPTDLPGFRLKLEYIQARHTV